MPERADRSTEDAGEFWERPDVVDEFAGRAADHRLARIVDSFARPREVRVLDVGCAGGRNTEFLAARGFDVYALDPSQAMVERTRTRLASVLGPAEAGRRVAAGRMQDLKPFDAEQFDLVVALGVYHNATSDDDFHRALGETARVLKPGGRVLTATFSPRSRPKGEPMRRLSPAGHLYSGFDSGALFLLEPPEFDRAMAAHGLVPAEPTAEGKTALEAGFRISVNGLYVKRT